MADGGLRMRGYKSPMAGVRRGERLGVSARIRRILRAVHSPFATNEESQ